MHDKGISPNPFGGICTLAACSPNHQGINMQPGDWILGNSTMSTGNLLIYAMRISKILDLHTDFHDPRYQLKTASTVDWQRRGGDNIYFLDEAAQWRQGLGFFHTEPERRKQDTKCPRVFYLRPLILLRRERTHSPGGIRLSHSDTPGVSL
jgi:hypothetical protein